MSKTFILYNKSANTRVNPGTHYTSDASARKGAAEVLMSLPGGTVLQVMQVVGECQLAAPQVEWLDEPQQARPYEG